MSILSNLSAKKDSLMDVSENIVSAIEINALDKGAKEPKQKGILNSLKGKVATSSALMSAIYFGAIIPAFANETPATAGGTKADTAISSAGITKAGNDQASLMTSLSGIVYLIMGIGALWAVAWIIIGGMLLAGSGSNPQKRTGGLAAIAVACIGVYVIYKAYTIAGWATNL